MLIDQTLTVLSCYFCAMAFDEAAPKKKLHVLSMLTKTSNSIREKDINTKEAEEKQEQLGIKKLRIKILGKIILNEI